MEVFIVFFYLVWVLLRNDAVRAIEFGDFTINNADDTVRVRGNDRVMSGDNKGLASLFT